MNNFPELLVAVKSQNFYKFGLDVVQLEPSGYLDSPDMVRWRVIKNFKLTIDQAFAFAQGRRTFGCVELMPVSKWESKKRDYFEQNDGSYLEF